MAYKLVFDVVETGYAQNTLPVLIAFGFMFCGGVAALLLLAVFKLRFRPGTSVAMPVLILVSVILIGAIGFAGTLPPYRSLVSALREGRCVVVEGLVAHYLEEVSKERRESFDVSGHRFSFSEYVGSAGFHQTRAHGGPLRENVWVRIHYFGEQIARLEIAQ